MTPMWEKAWNLGYDSASQLLGKTEREPQDQLQGFLDTEGTHWLDQIARTGLKNASSRSEVIARTEIARAMNAGAIQSYRDNGVAYKHLGLPRMIRVISAKMSRMTGLSPWIPRSPMEDWVVRCILQCRCVPAPCRDRGRFPAVSSGKAWNDSSHQYARSMHSGAGNCECGDAEGNHPPGSTQEDESRVAWLLIRARDEDGKWRYLLQQRPDGTWGMPGGATHIGESGFTAAYRETTEEIGELPQLTVVHDFTHLEEDGKTAYLYLCETSLFKPSLDGGTPHETLSVGWFRRSEISDLNLTPKFRDDWESKKNPPHLKEALKDSANKALQNMVNENGEWMVLDDPDRHGAGMGARWPYPHHANGEEYGDAGPGGYPGATPGR